MWPRTSVEYLKRIRTSEGILSFWKGNGASILQKMATTGSNYLVYEKIKLALKPFWRTERDVGFGTRLLAGSLAGALNVTLAYPLDLIRTNISSHNVKNEWGGLWSTLVALHGAHGWKFLTRGLLSTQLCQGLNIGLHFGIYETVNTYWSDRSERGRSTFLHSMLCGQLAGLIASTIVQPLDLIRRRQQLLKSSAADEWFFVVAARIVRDDGGVRALYRGIVPELCKVALFPASGLNFYIYELVRQRVFDHTDGVR